jgi:hypothetical protein
MKNVEWLSLTFRLPSNCRSVHKEGTNVLWVINAFASVGSFNLSSSVWGWGSTFKVYF